MARDASAEIFLAGDFVTQNKFCLVCLVCLRDAGQMQESYLFWNLRNSPHLGLSYLGLEADRLVLHGGRTGRGLRGEACK